MEEEVKLEAIWQLSWETAAGAAQLARGRLSEVGNRAEEVLTTQCLKTAGISQAMKRRKTTVQVVGIGGEKEHSSW